MWTRAGLCIVLLGVCTQVAAKERQISVQELSSSFEQLNKTVGPSVVHITASGYTPRDLGGNRFVISKQRSAGSGVIVDSNGYIITNAHVVRGATSIKVRLPPVYTNGPRAQTSIVKPIDRPHSATLIGFDTETDIALLKIDVKGLTAARIGDSDTVKTGQVVLVFGSPLGLAGSVSFGIVSSVGRQVRPDHPMVYIQTDAPINPGNSGGPLVSARGDVVGINTFILSQSGGSEGLGFSVPSNIMKSVYRQLRARGNVERGTIGVHAQTVTPTLASGLGLARSWGVLVADVFPKSPAEAAGIKPGDLILTLNDKRIENGRQFDVNIYQQTIGKKVRVQVLRGGKSLTFTPEVVRRPDGMAGFAEQVDPRQHLIGELGVLAVQVDAKAASALGRLREPGGVLVLGTAANTQLTGDSAFLPGDIIRNVNTIDVRTVPELRKVARGLVRGESAVIRVERRGEFLYLPFELE
ncbi:MAG: trypsin-like peptidase domain-containing protein [Myxococcota bacterium]